MGRGKAGDDKNLSCHFGDRREGENRGSKKKFVCNLSPQSREQSRCDKIGSLLSSWFYIFIPPSFTAAAVLEGKKARFLYQLGCG